MIHPVSFLSFYTLRFRFITADPVQLMAPSFFFFQNSLFWAGLYPSCILTFRTAIRLIPNLETSKETRSGQAATDLQQLETLFCADLSILFSFVL